MHGGKRSTEEESIRRRGKRSDLCREGTLKVRCTSPPGLIRTKIVCWASLCSYESKKLLIPPLQRLHCQSCRNSTETRDGACAVSV
jgi:hypothetical protein